ncbi:MAG: type II toxin-antitoxin system RelE/ParE family toxin [Allosphingosinicella sp.]|uniref:type II toxin-antitoxin system RelE/ParE family toxin n=1 Tax=Allosphingosinicella sp. TaxID=2823234 RepID=UPI003923DE30
MTAKPVLRRRAARNDIIAASDHYEDEAGADIARRFLGAVEEAIGKLGERPGAGSPRLGEALGMPRLRSRPVDRFPYLIFYEESGDRVEIVRVLHTKRDLAGILGTGED